MPYPDEMMGGAPPEPPADFEATVERLRGLLIELAENDGSVSEQERLSIEKMLTEVQKWRADREKERQAALGGGPATNFLRRASGSQ